MAITEGLHILSAAKVRAESESPALLCFNVAMVMERLEIPSAGR